MSSHTGVSCDACLKTNFPQRRYKCLLCDNYDLCGSCHDLRAESEQHRSDHPMQCILTKTAYDLFYAGETIVHRSIVSLTCPYCAHAGFLPRTLFAHCLDKHPINPSNHSTQSLVMCPICVVLPAQTCHTRFVSLADHLAREHETGDTPAFPTRPVENKRELVDHEDEDEDEEDEEGVPLYLLAERLFLKEESRRHDYSAIVQSQRALHRRTFSRQVGVRGAMRGRHLHHTSYSIIARSALENMADSNIYSESFADVLYPQYFPSVKSTHHYHDQNETNDRIIPKKSDLPTSKQKRSCHHPTQASFPSVNVSQSCQEQLSSLPVSHLENSECEKDPRSLMGKLLTSLEPPISCSDEEERNRRSFVASVLLRLLISSTALPT